LNSLEARWNAFVDEALKSSERPTGKAIHDLRVAIRRLIALIEMIKPIIVKNNRPKILKELKGHLKSLSTLRDIQVQILLTRKLAKDFPIMLRFLAVLTAEEKLAMKRARREINRIDTSIIGRNLQETKDELAHLFQEKLMVEMAHSIVRGELSKTFGQIIYLRDEILHEMRENDKRIHELRIVFKHFRYMVEALRPTLPHVTDGTLKSMNRFQVRMGDIQDTDVLIAGLDKYSVKVSRREREQFTPISNFLINLRNDRVNGFVASIDELYQFWERIR
ncbi:MAG: CHAD domain-containing protein, partial [Candidatus Kryptoniota bacterium]